MNGKSTTFGEPAIHLLCGSIGAGKSTYAKKLADDICAIHLSVDEWMVSLFGPDVDDAMDWAWISERALRCDNKIIATACRLAELGVSSILEVGLLSSRRRSEVASAIEKVGYSLQTHYLNVDPSERWRRVQRRNLEKGETYSLSVTRQMFDFIESTWEPLGRNEWSTLNVKEVSIETTP